MFKIQFINQMGQLSTDKDFRPYGKHPPNRTLINCTHDYHAPIIDAHIDGAGGARSVGPPAPAVTKAH